MKPIIKLSLVAVCFGCLSAETIVLDTIDVEDKELKAEKKVYQEAKAVSARDDIATSTQNLDTILRTIPGTFTNQDKSTGTIAPNIRGSQGLGRVNTMIDGVTQTFYSSGVDDGKSGSTSQFGATIDPNFIAGVDVERGTFGGKSGINSLMGSANFRTLGINDVIKGDKNFGFLGKYQTGDNAYKNNYMGTFAGRTYFDDGSYMGVLIGHSNRKISQNYKIGGGIRIDQINDMEFENLHKQHMKSYMDVYKPSAKKGDIVGYKEGLVPDPNCPFGEVCSPIKVKVPVRGDGPKDEYLKEAEKIWKETSDQYIRTPFDPNKLKQDIKSYMAKFEYADEHNFLTLSFRNLENKIWSRKIEANNYQINYNLNNDENIDLNVLLNYNETKQKYSDIASISGKELISGLETKNKSLTFDISNTFKSDFSDISSISTTIGLNNLKNSYSKSRHPYELVWFNEYKTLLKEEKDPVKRKKLLDDMLSGNFWGYPPDHMSTGGIYRKFDDWPSNDGYRANTFQPDGKQRFFTIYGDNYLRYSIFDLNLNANLVKYDYKGQYFDRVKKGLYDDYEENEFLMDDYGDKKAFNYSATLTANLHELFTPFVSYSKSERFPNLQELYFSQRTIAGVSNNLDNEIAKTLQVGFNSFKENLLFDSDIFGFKAVYYNTKIDNYIHNVLKPPYTDHSGYGKETTTINFQNYDKEVRKEGVELELSYDMGAFFINLAYARQRTTQPTSASDASAGLFPAPSKPDYYSMGHGISKVTQLPKDYGYLDTGIRLLNEKLVIGSRMKYFGESKRALYSVGDNKPLHDPRYDGEQPENKKHQKYVRWTEVIEKQPLIFDFYVSYEPIENLIIKAELQNAFDKQYIDPLDSNNDAASQRSYSILNGENNALSNYAKGRTAVLSFEYRY